MGSNRFFSNLIRVEFLSHELKRVEFWTSNSNRTEPNRVFELFKEFFYVCCFYLHKTAKYFFGKNPLQFFTKKFCENFIFFKFLGFFLWKVEKFRLANFGSNFELLRTLKTRYKNSSFRTRTKFGLMSNGQLQTQQPSWAKRQGRSWSTYTFSQVSHTDSDVPRRGLGGERNRYPKGKVRILFSSSCRTVYCWPPRPKSLPPSFVPINCFSWSHMGEQPHHRRGSTFPLSGGGWILGR